MKKNLTSALLAALVFFCAAALWATMTFSVVNKTSFNLGAVTIYNNSGVPSTVNVPGTGTFTLSIDNGAAGATINGQPVSKGGQVTSITTPQGFVVQATMTGNQIVVTDQSLVYRPPPIHGK